jgi:predicted PurR-regulated permease PerM
MIAYFQGSTYLAIPPIWFTLVVVLLYLGVQQLENAVLVPRIIGGSSTGYEVNMIMTDDVLITGEVSFQ